MKLDHVAIWAVDIELMRAFYEKYFDARSNLKYQNERKNFASYFLTFPGGGRLELMHRPDILRNPDSQNSREFIGYAHLGWSRIPKGTGSLSPNDSSSRREHYFEGGKRRHRVLLLGPSSILRVGPSPHFAQRKLRVELLKRFLSRIDDLIARVSKKTH
jgi:catechol 2,3-dioxygenase-like lactoylglutathione lyase family enzyme